MNINFWSGKKIFLTGHTGFKGSWLSLWLQLLGAEVMGFALKPPTQPNLFELANIAETMSSVQGDIDDVKLLKKHIDNFQPEIIIHMAAQSLVKESYKDPIKTYRTNVMGTVHLLEAARNCNNTHVILNVTSDKCYENKEIEWSYRESDAMGGYDPYSSSKGCAELITASYRRSFFPQIAVASARAGNVIGGGDWASDRLVPDLVRSINAKKPLCLRYPKAVRPWQHVLEPLSGYLMLIEKCWHEPEKYSQAWNFGPQHHDIKSVQWLVETFLQEWDTNQSYFVEENVEEHEAKLLQLDSSKAQHYLKWQPTLNLHQALHWTMDWYKNSTAGVKMRDYTLNQIQTYQSALINNLKDNSI